MKILSQKLSLFRQKLHTDLDEILSFTEGERFGSGQLQGYVLCSSFACSILHLLAFFAYLSLSLLICLHRSVLVAILHHCYQKQSSSFESGNSSFTCMFL